MSPSERYSRTAIVLHWLIALAVVVQFSWGWVMQSIAKQPPGLRADALRKSDRPAILALMCVRLIWRWRHRPPPLPAMPKWGAIRAVHALMLYATLFVMPSRATRLRVQRLSRQVLRHHAAGVGMEGRAAQGFDERRPFHRELGARRRSLAPRGGRAQALAVGPRRHRRPDGIGPRPRLG